ncbi:hypothetical protein [Micromonospora sp. HM5-17]|uniref:hypothetical protein n=1 Tax=Micromonospora sp. HM5-17 TaxID=2487710 RepID=UPI0011CE2B02|nr:hypothetical protein [Micromonospora sp. HM5-17]
MGIRAWWESRRRRRVVEVERAAREQDMVGVEAARQRVIELARREREERDRRQMAWIGPARIDGLPLVTWGRARQYRTGGGR